MTTKLSTRFWMTALAAMTFTGCGAPSADPPDPVGKCYEIRDVYCSRGNACNRQTGTPVPDYFASCKSEFATKTDCSKFTKIIGHPDACIDDVSATPCTLCDHVTNLLELPASCTSRKLFK